MRLRIFRPFICLPLLALIAGTADAETAVRAEFTLPITTANERHRALLSQPSEVVETGQTDLQPLLNRMFHAMKNAHGDGIAAIQIGEPKRVFLFLRPAAGDELQYQTAINPEILELSDSTVMNWDGCLSVPEGIGRVRRHTSVTLRYEDEDGTVITETLGGLYAFIVQHEMDHLNGRLFTHYLPGKKLIPHRAFFDLFDDLTIDCDVQRLSPEECRDRADRAWNDYQAEH